MLKDHAGRYEHEKFKRLCALAASGNLAPFEVPELEEHLRQCEECREVLSHYRVLTTQGMAVLADTYVEKPGAPGWDGASARGTLMEEIGAELQAVLERQSRTSISQWRDIWSRQGVKSFAAMALAAGLILMVGLNAYRMGVQRHSQPVAALTQPSVDVRFEKLSADKKVADEQLGAQAANLAQLQAEISEKGKELTKLRSTLQELEDHSNEAEAESSQAALQSRTISQERDALNLKLQAIIQSYESDKIELATLRAERDKTALRTSSLEKKIEELTAENRDQDRRLKDAEQYLTADRDVRELMGARKLYIADVFDVDGSSRTKKPFGRVFYTQGKSLIFYAFDLDREPGVVNASAFQVWGQKEAPQGESAVPVNLGILYMDNESNRRWVMRFDEPKQLAEIDAVFVTVEPRGGSHKPTSKPFLYALLRNEANHP